MTGEPGAAFISPRLAKAMSSPLRSRIMMELSNGDLSPKEFCEIVGAELWAAARAFRQLADYGLVEIVDRKRGDGRRGATEKIYRRIGRAYFDTPTWEDLPPFLRDDISINILETYMDRVNEALATGTFDAEVDRHLSWDNPTLDRIAWDELGQRLDEVLNWLPILEAESSVRMASSGEEPIPTTVGLAAFRSPTRSQKEASRETSA
jgi:hypothetical protein